MIEESVEDAHIRFSTQIIKRLGEELNPSIDQSVLELVKNSYDANAIKCTVILKNVSSAGGTITISDDGDGMDKKAIMNSYLVLGQSEKSFDKMTRLGRIPAGSKGLGRLAALRMGKFVSLCSVPLQEISIRNSLEIDWDKFDDAKLVDDVIIKITSSANAKDEPVGTTITIKNLKQKVNDRDVRKVARGLILLSDPFEDDPNAFKPKLDAEEFKDLENLVSKRYFDDADYHLSANLDKDGNAKAEILDYKGNVLFAATHADIAVKRKGKMYSCPIITFDLWAFILNSTTFTTRRTSISEVKEWLNEFGGVHFYENRLRVNPYGNQGNDWLDLNLSRAKSPEERPSTNNSIGVVRVRESKGLLNQKTDRSGFIEDDTFHEIKGFCQDALEWMARKRLEIAEKKRARDREHTQSVSNASKEMMEKEIAKLPTSERVAIKKIFQSYDKAQDHIVKSLKSEVQLYRTLSTAGITAATFSHESRGNPIKVLEQSIKAIERRAKQHLGVNYESSLLEKPIGMIYRAISSLAVLSSATLKLLSNDKRRVTKVEVHKIINNILETFDPFFKGRDISVNVNFGHGNPFLRSSEAALESILTNLLNNSVVAIENKNPATREIQIKTEVNEDIIIITVSDNGTGIEGIAIKDIWLPGETTSPNGTGLGLTIVRDAVSDLGGSLRANKHSALGGAELIVEIPIIGI